MTWALITGASSGIGLELAGLFARDEHDLVLVARSADKLQQLGRDLEQRHGIKWRVIPTDLSDPGAPAALMQALREAQIEVEFLVNNAGYGTYGLFATIDWKAERDLLEVNVVALTALTKLLLVGMVARNSGRILNVASTAAFQPGPLMAAYYASKAYVLSLSEALAEELRGTGVTVTVLCPGPTTTGFQARAGMEGVRLVSGNPLMMTATEVARAGYDGMMAGKAIVIPGMANKIGVQALRVSPRALVRKVVRWMQERG